ncbi:MAG: hypothetical protein HW414_808 [Dehalococcoidia bacterium]|nr:hypothetical protein [Dehalococcoidia bacterium]
MPCLPPLRPYQKEIARAVLESVLGRRGLTFSVEVARQGGKNELSAQLEVLLLTLNMGRGGNLVKASPTFKPQSLISRRRLEDRLRACGYGRFLHSEMGYVLRLGRARQLFFSADRSSGVVGHTADILLELDESQDILPEKYYKEFRPMGAAGNVTAVLWGTTWDDASLLEQAKQMNLELERRDGLKRHFRYDWQEVARYNEDYGRYVEGERERLGEKHPLFLTQYCLESLPGGGGFLSPAQMAQLQGSHSRRHGPETGRSYVAGLDLAGEAGTAGAPNHGGDATVLTIGEVSYKSSLVPMLSGLPQIQVVEQRCWQGEPHDTLFLQLVDLLKRVWGCRKVAVDATGVGAGMASFLRKTLGASVVLPLLFSAQAKSRFGFDLLAAINSGRLQMYQGDGSQEYQECWRQMERARRSYRPNQTMNFYVDPAEGHDDFLMSLALLVEAAGVYSPRHAQGATA